MDSLLQSLLLFSVYVSFCISLPHVSANVLDLVYIGAPPSVPLFSHAHVYSPDDIMFHKTAGEHFALNITMGGVEELVILDTGSTFTWIRVPFHTPSLHYLDCWDEDCGRVQRPWCKRDICHYNIKYLYGNASGLVVADTFQLRNIQGRVTFGIAEKFLPEPLGTSSIRDERRERCYSTPDQKVRPLHRSFNSFGIRITEIPYAVRLRPNDKHYVLPLSSILFDGSYILNAPYEEKYIILDTGIRYTMLFKPLYDAIGKEVKELLVGKHKMKPVCSEQCQPPDCTCNFPNCYFSEMGESIHIPGRPLLEFRFQNTGYLDLHDGIYMVRTPQLHWCLAVRQLELPESDVNIGNIDIVGVLGNQMQKDRMFIYDVENSVIAFAKAQCVL